MSQKPLFDALTMNSNFLNNIPHIPVVLFGRGGDEGLRREPRGVGRAGQPQGAPVPAEAHVVNEIRTLSSKTFIQ